MYDKKINQKNKLHSIINNKSIIYKHYNLSSLHLVKDSFERIFLSRDILNNYEQ